MTPEMLEFIKRHHSGMFPRSMWFKTEEMAVYLRAGPFVYRDGQRYDAVGIANVSVVPAKQRQGLFTSLLVEVIETARQLDYSVIIAEQVHNRDLHALLERNGFVLRQTGCADIIYEKWL